MTYFYAVRRMSAPLMIQTADFKWKFCIVIVWLENKIMVLLLIFIIIIQKWWHLGLTWRLAPLNSADQTADFQWYLSRK